MKKTDRGEEVGPKVLIEVTVLQGAPIQRVVDHTVGSIEQIGPSGLIRLIARDEFIDEGRYVIPSAGISDKTGDLVTRLGQMTGDKGTDET